MPLANPVVARLAAGDLCDNEFCGLLLVASWPAADAVQKKLSVFSVGSLPPSAYLYPATSLHCTVATLRAFTGGPLDVSGPRLAEAQRWSAVLDAAASAPSWPSGEIKLRMLAPTFEGAAGIVRYEETSPGGAIEAMRSCLQVAIRAAGGEAAVGGGDRSQAKALPGAPASDPAPHLPNIIHSTVLRWMAEPTEEELAAARAEFERVQSGWEALEFAIDAGSIRGVFEDVPFMHIPHKLSAQVFWSKKQEAQHSCPCTECTCGPDCKCVPGSPGCDPCGAFQKAKREAAAAAATGSS